jgi:KamA family protein
MAKVAEKFRFMASEYYLSLIDWEDPDDPIRRIIMPDAAEMVGLADGDLDPCDEAANITAPGVQHKYLHTALLICNDECAGLCRYCFRKRIFTHGAHEVRRDIEPGLRYISEHPEINNVLLTGGDALWMPTDRLQYILEELRGISHVDIIRLGTKVPAYNPERILNDPDLIRVIKRVSTAQRRVYMMVHFDHPNELTDIATAAVAELVNNGLIVLNQHPILRGVNDDPAVLAELYHTLASLGVCPYYLFIVRPTAGNDHFQVPIVETFFILSEARKDLSGLDKRLRLVMSHSTGKIEIMGVDNDYIYMRYHRARFIEDEEKFMVFERNDNALWLEDLVPVTQPGFFGNAE